MDFDTNNLDRLKAIISLKKRCLLYQEMSFSRNFFTDLSQEIDIVLSSIINDEISNASHRPGIKSILNEIITCNPYYDFIENEHCNMPNDSLFRDIQTTFVKKADEMVYGYLFRFYIAAFSVFEFWACRAYDTIIKTHKSKNSKKNKFDKKINALIALRIELINEHISQNNESDNIVKGKHYLDIAKQLSEKAFTEDSRANEIKDYIFNSNNYLSSREKIDFVISKVNIKTTKNNIGDVKSFINFSFALRNTIHTCGINKTGKNYSLNIGKCSVDMPSGSGANYNNHAEFIRKWHLVIDLYSDIFMHLGDNFEDDFGNSVNEI
ncbi:hypothetical protein VAWG001_29270 [Aeromonas dhakensis]|uniref:hypothetical protein n=1 Tax=Aeromonas dhakensis TaxID=196024 RepID=UPI002B3195A5|nr:hypothetical protein VAWG001_29270 [Aeromonas dhakensis]